MGFHRKPKTVGHDDHDDRKSAFVPVRDAAGRVTGTMDRGTADYLASPNPQPTQTSFDAVLARASRVRVATVRFRLTDGSYRGGEVLVDTSDPAAVESFRRAVAIRDDVEAGHIMRWQEHNLELMSGDETLATIGWLIPARLRWTDAWQDDAILRDGDALLDWVASQGRPELREEHQRRVAARTGPSGAPPT